MARPNKRPRVIGPFFLIAIIISAGVFAWQKQQNAQRLQNAPPPVVEHQVIDAPLTLSVPPPGYVLSHASRLGLKAEQARRLEPLAQAYANELAPLQAQTQAASQRFAAYQQGKQSQKQVPVAELQEQMAEVSQLSGRMVSLRRNYWDQIAPLLTDGQKRQAQELWRQSLRPAKGQEHK